MAGEMSLSWAATLIEGGITDTLTPRIALPSVAIVGGNRIVRSVTIPRLVDGDPIPEPTRVWDYTQVASPKQIILNWSGGTAPFGLLAWKTDAPTSADDITPAGTAIDWSYLPLTNAGFLSFNGVATYTFASVSTRHGQDGDGFPNILTNAARISARLYSIVAQAISYTEDCVLEYIVVE